MSWDFFTKLPNGRDGRGLAGGWMLVGLATAFAVPVGMLAARLRFVAELLGVPPTIVGVFGCALLVDPVWMNASRGRFSGWAAAFPLGRMVLPVVIGRWRRRLVPNSLREANYALGRVGGIR